jgi:hypothetical protein
MALETVLTDRLCQLIDSNFVLPYNNKAWVLATIGINSEALTVINKALKMEPTDPRSMDTRVQYFTT